MTDRAWTIDELDRVHPLPEMWTWVADAYGRPFARNGGDTVEVDHGELLSISHEGSLIAPPFDVALAVILASMGRDSFDTLADAMEDESRSQVSMVQDSTSARVWNDAHARADAFGTCAEMLRRGMVEP